VPLSEHLSRPITLPGSEPVAPSRSWLPRRFVWMGGLASIALFALGSVYGVPAAVSSPDYAAQLPAGAHLTHVVPHAPATTTTTAPAPTTTTTTAPAPTTTTTTVPPAPPALPAFGHATAWGCAAALPYLQAYAAPGFALDCPGYAEGHEAMTCIHGTPQYPDACPDGPTIAISDPCPQAYMNESANSWLMTGQLSTEQQKFGVAYSTIDPFGACP
jgi:hypothetical protein